ncbi:MAG: hypothetical protein AAF585_06480 [Verrucomicrobiota bacterium]
MAKAKVVKLEHIGSTLFGIGIFIVGYLIRTYLGAENGPMNSDDAKTMGLAGMVMMIFGGVIAIANILWIGLMLIFVLKKG